MAKPFYSIEEACDRLKKDENALRALVREGSLREFRDGGKVFFKAEDVDKLVAGGKADSGEITLEAADELPALLDESEGTNIIDLAPVDEPPTKKKKEGTMISSAGIGVFDEDELEIDADPMAKTQITAGAAERGKPEGSAGGGSGLLDLTREADDTSLGAELLDEIYPGEEEAAPRKPARPEPAEDSGVEEAPEAASAPPEPEYVAPTLVAVASDPTEGLFTGLLVGALLLLVVSGSVVAGTLQGFLPDYARFLSNNFWFLLGGAALLCIITLLIGWVLGRSTAPRRA